MEQGYFITGTDTDVGKTWVTLSLIEYFKNKGKSVAALKPVASGCHEKNGRLVNHDALMLQAHASVPIAYDLVNPYAYEVPISPHLAGKHNPADLEVIANCFNQVKVKAQILLVEGAGGWYSPINNTQQNSDLAVRLALPVILTVSIKLGCINHALLTYRAILGSGVPCAGWIAVCNQADSEAVDETIASISAMINRPLLGVFPYLDVPDFAHLAGRLTL